MESWRPVGFDETQSDVTSGFSNIPYVNEQIRLSRIIESMMTSLVSPRDSADGIARRSNLDRLNLELCTWRDTLPDFAKWTRQNSSVNSVPGVVALQYVDRFLFPFTPCFQSISIELNYPSLTSTASFTTVPVLL